MSLLVAVPNHFVRVVSGLFGHVYSHLSWLSCPKFSPNMHSVLDCVHST